MWTNVMKCTPIPSKEYLHTRLSYIKDSGRLMWRDEPFFADNAKRNGYRAVRLDGKHFFAHRLVWQMKHGDLEPEEFLDHIDRDKTNNKLSNLRKFSHSQNAFNRGIQLNNTSGVTGVSYNKRDRKWVAMIKINGKQKCLGASKKKAEAIALRREAEQMYV